MSDEVESESVREGERMNVQIVKDPESGHVQIRLADAVFKFHQEDRESMVQGFAVGSFEDLPPSIDLTEEEKSHIEDGGNVYTQADVLELAEHSDYVEAVEHRIREQDRKSFFRDELGDGDEDGS